MENLIKSPMQLKSLVKNIAIQKGVPAQAIMQNYMLERLLERISTSKYQPNFILKGGMLVSSIIGLDSRTTMDMDTTIKNYPLSESSLTIAFDDILEINLKDNITFEMKNIQEIREDDDYGGFRISIVAIFETLKTPLKIDITTGDKITPKEIDYKFKLMFSDKTINILTYNIETVLAEKYETIITRSVLNTRLRDFYDIYILMKTKKDNIDMEVLRLAIESTAKARGSYEFVKDSLNRIDIIAKDEEMQKRWLQYQKEFDYAKDIEWNKILKTIYEISTLIEL